MANCNSIVSNMTKTYEYMHIKNDNIPTNDVNNNSKVNKKITGSLTLLQKMRISANIRNTVKTQFTESQDTQYKQQHKMPETSNVSYKFCVLDIMTI